MMSSWQSCRRRLVGLARQRGQHLREHRHHHLRPALADQRERAVEVEQHVADLRARSKPGRELNQAME